MDLADAAPAAPAADAVLEPGAAQRGEYRFAVTRRDADTVGEDSQLDHPQARKVIRPLCTTPVLSSVVAGSGVSGCPSTCQSVGAAGS